MDDVSKLHATVVSQSCAIQIGLNIIHCFTCRIPPSTLPFDQGDKVSITKLAAQNCESASCKLACFCFFLSCLNVYIMQLFSC